MKKVILNFEQKDAEFKELVQEAFNKDMLSFLISEETLSEFENIERVISYSKNQDLTVNNTIFTDKEALKRALERKKPEMGVGYYKELSSKEDELEIVELSKNLGLDFVIVSARDWKIIPFENLIAEMHKKDTELIAEVQDVKEAELMFKTLEIGVDGIMITPKDANDLVDLKKLLSSTFTLDLSVARVKSIKAIPESERVCVDTTSLLKPGEGMLVGSTAMGFALVHAEVFETQFVASRPFRVNAGDVSAYILVPGKEPNSYRTNYLSELEGGDKVLVINNKGKVRIVSVGRVKIETRPMLRFELEVEQESKTIPIKSICQNAETIRLVDKEGNAISVVDIKEGDQVLVHVGPGATHFGTAIKETIIEK